MPMETLEFKLDHFEGPLDLLLSLIAKHQYDIFDVPITELLAQYLDAIAAMREEHLEIASEFLEMAAHLVYIKTVSLLPKPEEAEELKRELTGRLLEYRICKEMAEWLKQEYIGHAIHTRRPQPAVRAVRYECEHEPEVLKAAYLAAAGKFRRRQPPPKSAFSGIVSRRMVSVTSRILYVLRRLYRDGELPYQDFFQTADRAELVATFLAMLELVKSGRVLISDDNQTVYFNRSHAETQEAST